MVDLFDQPTGKGSGELILVIGPESGELLLVNRRGGSDKVDGGGVDRGGGLGEAGSEWNMEGRCGRWNMEGRWICGICRGSGMGRGGGGSDSRYGGYQMAGQGGSRVVQ